MKNNTTETSFFYVDFNRWKHIFVQSIFNHAPKVYFCLFILAKTLRQTWGVNSRVQELIFNSLYFYSTTKTDKNKLSTNLGIFCV